MALPDFLIIGAMKCGTSTLAAQLAHQDGIFVTTPKEPNFFSDDAVHAKGLDWYRSLFGPAAPGDLLGEASTHYTKRPIHPDTLARLIPVLPAPRLVYMIRDPMDRIVSHYIHEWTMGAIGDTLEAALEAHPELIATVKKLSRDGKKVGWNGLLVGDLTQPRGGPMLSGHASHQAGLDADIWLTPMPDRRLSRKEREELSATSMLARNAKGRLTNQKLDKRRFTKAHAGIIRTAAQYRNVERIFVHPTIKRELCRQYPKKPKWLRKVRAQFGHHYHFHVRIGCPSGSPGCKSQAPVPSYGCDKATMDYWFNVAYGPRPKPKPGAKPPKPRKKRQIRLRDLPRQCRTVLSAGNQGTTSGAYTFVSSYAPTGRIAKPSPRPKR